MPDYRRANIQGGTYFFTVVTYRRQQILCTPHVREALREGVQFVRALLPSLSILGCCCLTTCTVFGSFRLTMRILQNAGH
jgi:REP element-mobilizing transposase RayT